MKLNEINEKDLAVVLSVFGSSEEAAMEEYHNFYNMIRSQLNSNIELRMSISSRYILKKLDNQKKDYKTLLEQLANLDHMGYKNVIVASINLFPIKEHQTILNIMNSINQVSTTTHFITEPLFGESFSTNNILKVLNNRLRQNHDESTIFLYIAHGTSTTYHQGNQLFSYLRDYLHLINENNYLYTIEGSYTYEKDLFLKELRKSNSNIQNRDLVIVPLLLVAGNHYRDDIISIQNELISCFNSAKIAKNDISKDQFSLLSVKEVRNYFYDKIISVMEAIR